jgi:hypothetical protein
VIWSLPASGCALFASNGRRHGIASQLRGEPQLSVDDALCDDGRQAEAVEALARLLGDFGQKYAIVPVDGGGYEAVCRATEPIRARSVAEMREKLERDQTRRQRDM